MKIAAIFDLDETIYPGYSLKDLAKFLFKKGKIRGLFLLKVFYWMILKKFNLLDDEKAFQESLTLLKGSSIDNLINLIQECFASQMKNKIPQKIIDIIRDHKKSGHILILATETIEEVAKEFSQYLGFDQVIATKAEIIDDKLSGKLASPVCMKQKKAQMIKEFCRENDIDLKNSYIYGGRLDDQAILELSDNSTVVNPDFETKKLAQRKNWQVIFT